MSTAGDCGGLWRAEGRGNRADAPTVAATAPLPRRC